MSKARTSHLVLRWLAHWLQRVANPALCTLEFTAAGVRTVRGTPPPGFVADCADVGRELGLGEGQVDVVVALGRRQLRFSPDLPPACHQRLRNVFGVHNRHPAAR